MDVNEKRTRAIKSRLYLKRVRGHQMGDAWVWQMVIKDKKKKYTKMGCRDACGLGKGC